MSRLLLAWLLPLVTISLTIIGTRSLAEDEPKGANSRAEISEVIAEGAGATADEALKDAFRNAVRQVVGAVVDAETLVKNDEVIDDQVLTYSSGFVKKYDEVPGSKKLAKGLHRIKIKAQIERRSVVAKLKAAKVTVKELDGKGLFAEAVTTAEASQNATQLLAKVMADLPKLLTATVIGKPEYDRGKSEVVLNLEIAADQKAYQGFVTRLEQVLGKIALSKTSTLVKDGPAIVPPYGGFSNHFPGIHVAPKQGAILGPIIAAKNADVWCLWVCSSTSGNHASQRWNGYVVDADAKTTLVPFMNRHDYRVNNPEFRQDEPKSMVQVSLSDADATVVAADEFEVSYGSDSLNRQHIVGQLPEFRLPWLLTIISRHRDRNWPNESGAADGRYFVVNGYVAPFALKFATHGLEQVDLEFVPKQTYQRRIKLTLEELKQVKDVKCSVVYTPGAAATK